MMANTTAATFNAAVGGVVHSRKTTSGRSQGPHSLYSVSVPVRDSGYQQQQRKQTQQAAITSNSLSRQNQQKPPLSLTLDSAPDFNQLSIEGHEADTESATSFKYHRRRDSGITKSPRSRQITSTSPSVRPGTSEGCYSPASNFSPADKQSSSYFQLRPTTSHELRSPSLKRPPASRSSNGVATSTGPPPAISTQRVFSFETQRVPSNKPADSQLSPNYPEEANPVFDYTSSTSQDQESDYHHSTIRRKRPSQSHSDTAVDWTSIPSNTIMERREKRYSADGGRLTAHRLSAHLKDTNLALQDAASNGSSHEDLFLNMAQIANGEDRGEHSERKGDSTPKYLRHNDILKSRIGLPSDRQSISRSESSDRAGSSHGRKASLTKPEINTDFRTPPTERITRDRTYPQSAHPLDGRYTSKPSQVSPGTRRNEGLENSPTVREMPSSYHTRFRSAHISGAQNMFNSSPLGARHNSMDQEPMPSLHRNNTAETESSVSTTAPSTVWDELDDLKQRIRKLEFTGKLPPSNASSERPRTAATSATTMSSSPKRNGFKSVSPVSAGFDDISPHPLLNSALAKAQTAINTETYRALEATSSEALQLAKMTSASTTPTALERQLKRRADNMCRSLTELCIALAAANTSQSERPTIRARSSSRDAVTLLDIPSQSQQDSSEAVEERRPERAQSLDPEVTIGQRALSRLEARRTSMRVDAMNSALGQPSPQTELHFELKTPTQSTMGTRTNTVLQRRRLVDGQLNEEADATIRPVSRAQTDLARANTTSAIDRERKRMSREYTSSHPLPSPHIRNFPNLNNIAGSRRSYLSNNSIAAILPNNPISNSNSTISTSPKRDKDLTMTPPGHGFSPRRYLSRAGVPQEETNTTATTFNQSRITDPRQRLASSGAYTNARALLSARAGDRRSFHSAVEEQDQEQDQEQDYTYEQQQHQQQQHHQYHGNRDSDLRQTGQF